MEQHEWPEPGSKTDLKVHEMIFDAVAKEREECAKIADSHWLGKRIALAIRARGWIDPLD